MQIDPPDVPDPLGRVPGPKTAKNKNKLIRALLLHGPRVVKNGLSMAPSCAWLCFGSAGGKPTLDEDDVGDEAGLSQPISVR